MLALVAISGCSGADSGGTADGALRADVLSALASEFVVSGTGALDAHAGALQTAGVALCASPSELTLAAARDAWWRAQGSLKHIEVVRFGPVVEYPLRLGPKLDDWPVHAAAVEELIAGDLAVDPDAFASLGTATRGLPVAEYLLWGEEPALVLEGLLQSERRCDVVVGVCADIATNAGLLHEAWTSEWRARISEPGDHPGDAYDSLQSVLDEWVNRMAFTVEDLRVERLGKPLGDSAGGELQPDVIESPYAARSVENLTDILAGVRAVWGGGSDPGAGSRIRTLVKDNPALEARVEARLSASEERLQLVRAPLLDTLSVEPEAVVFAQEALRALQVAIQVDLAQELGVTVAFNDNDGD